MVDRAGVMRAVQQQWAWSGAGLEAVLGRRLGVVQGAFLQPGDRVDHHRRGEFATGQYVIADRKLLVDFGRDQALVDAFVTAAEQDQSLASGQFADLGLSQARALGAEIDDLGWRWI